MSDEPIARKTMRLAEREASDDVSRLVAAVPELLREARRHRIGESIRPAAFDQLAIRALPRLAAVTALAVFAATTFVLWDRGGAASSASFESVILGGDGDGATDAAVDALLELEGYDG